MESQLINKNKISFRFVKKTPRVRDMDDTDYLYNRDEHHPRLTHGS